MKRSLSLRILGAFLFFGVLALPRSGVLASTSPAPIPGCSYGACAHTVLRLLNEDRAQHGLRALKLTGLVALGRGSCVGSYGHSVAMAESGSIWHINAQFPQASFPHNVCGRYGIEGENVGESSSGSVFNDLQAIHSMMMSEPHDRQTCATTINHACNILSRAFHKVGIGLYYTNGTTWLTEDFVE